MTYLSPKRLESTEEDSEELLRQILKQLTIIVSQLQSMTDEQLDDSEEKD
jgi:hypothetical protein